MSIYLLLIDSMVIDLEFGKSDYDLISTTIIRKKLESLGRTDQRIRI